MSKVEIKAIARLSQDVLEKCGMPTEDAITVADTIVYAHRIGKHTHGINRLPIYVRKIEENLMEAETQIDMMKDAPAMSTIDVHHGFGQVAASKGMNLCIEKAGKLGVGVVGICNSNNFGTAGYFGQMAAEKNMVGIVMGNSAPAVAPTGGKTPVLGTNPICFAFPNCEGEPPIILDMAVTTAARGKIRLAAKNGEKIPLGWAMDQDGNPTEDPNDALKGSLNPIGGYKGFGLSLVVDIMAGLLTGSAFGGDVNPLNHPDALSRYGHMLMALNIEFFMPKEEYFAKMKVLIENLRKSGDVGEVSLPGERSYQNAQKSNKYVELHTNQINDANSLAQKLGVKSRI